MGEQNTITQPTIIEADLGFLGSLLDLAAIRKQADTVIKLAEGATDGEWYQDPIADPGSVWVYDGDEGEAPTVAEADERDTPLIAWCQPGAYQLARTALILADEVERLRHLERALERAHSLIEAMREDVQVQHGIAADCQRETARAKVRIVELERELRGKRGAA